MPRVKLYRAVQREESLDELVDIANPAGNVDYIDTLRVLLKSYLPDGYMSARAAAELTGISERTLARKLAAKGLTYGMLIDEVRFIEAKRELQKQDAKIEDVAISVGFDDQSKFTRMFHRVSGLTPGEFRREIQH